MALTACADDSPDASGGDEAVGEEAAGEGGQGHEGGEEGCVPSEAQWDRVVKDLVFDGCASCHGDTPDFGAPYGLMDYDELLVGDPGLRPVDRMAARLQDLSMPPPSRTQPPHGSVDTIAEWASCGTVHPDHSSLLVASAEAMGAPAEPPADAVSFELLALDFPIGPEVLDLYQCFVFEPPIDEPRFARRFDMVIDESRVLHHLVLYRDTNKSSPDGNHRCGAVGADYDFLYAWAPGQDSFQFPEGGLRIKPGDRFVVQVHYNNGAAIEGVRDNSGVRIWHSAPEGTEYGMLAPGPLSFQIPPGERIEIVGDCELSEKLTVLGGMPHMHGIGAGFRQEILRVDGTTEPFIELEGWSFESQLIFHTPAVFEPGDRLRTTCIFDNPSDVAVLAGPRSSDEMCFNFMYVTPPPKHRFCDSQVAEEQGPLAYVLGECADEDAITNPPAVQGRYKEEAPPGLAGGTLEDGRYLLQEYTLYLATFDLGFGKLDSEASAIEARGQLFVQGGEIAFDMTSLVVVAMESGTSYPRETKTSISGSFAAAPQESSVVVTPDCGPEDPVTFEFEVDGDRVTLQSELSPSGVTLHPRMTFHKVQ